MHTGAVVMMDALGFKGIWKREGVTEAAVLGKLARLAEASRGGLRELLAAHPLSADAAPMFEDLRVMLLSDTVAVGLGLRESAAWLREPNPAIREGRERHARALALHVAARFASDFLRRALDGEGPPLAYRGCVTFGAFSMEDRFLLGPAVDEAAGLMEAAQGAFVWFGPAALETYLVGEAWMGTPFLVPYKVPIKGGEGFETLVISPLGSTPADAGELADLQRRLRTSFVITPGGALDIAIKRDHTMRFVGVAREHLAAHADPRS